MGCSSATTFKYTRADGSIIHVTSAKQQNEESAKWSVTVGSDGSLRMDLGTKGTQVVNMTTDSLNAILGLVK